MNNYSQPGDVLTLTAPYDVASGQGALVGSIFGIATSTVASGAEGEFLVAGVVGGVNKTSAQAWTVGLKLYWDNSNKRLDSDSTVGLLVGVATAVADNPSSTGSIRLNGSAPSTAEGPQAAITSLTDNGGGTADGTVAAQAEPVTLTDSTGLSGTHDDTLAATAAPTTLTDSTGLSGTHDDTLAATTVPADLTGGESPTEAEHNALLAVTRVIAQNASDTGQKVIELVTLAGVQAQNTSNVAQKVIELVTLAATAQDNLKEVTTKLESILVALRAAGIIAT
jgi:predicted RecA/RadA family phage recombinase